MIRWLVTRWWLWVFLFWFLFALAVLPPAAAPSGPRCDDPCELLVEAR